MSTTDSPIDRARIDTAVRCLHDLLPLRERQRCLDAALRSVHRAILRSLVETGRPPAPEAIAGLLPDGDVTAAIARLADAGLIVLDAEGDEVIGAYPMTTASTAHELTIGGGHRVHAMCSLDALSVSPMFLVEVTIRSRCHVTGDAVVIRQLDRNLEVVEPAAPLVGIRWQEAGAVAAHGL